MYFNSVVLEIVQSQTDPHALCLAAYHYLSKTGVSVSENAPTNLQTLSSALVSYVRLWFSDIEGKPTESTAEVSREQIVGPVNSFLHCDHNNEGKSEFVPWCFKGTIARAIKLGLPGCYKDKKNTSEKRVITRLG